MKSDFKTLFELRAHARFEKICYFEFLRQIAYSNFEIHNSRNMYNPIEMKFGKILICLLVLSTSGLSHPLENKTEANQSKLIDYNEPEKEVFTKSQMEEIELLKTWLNISKTELDFAAKEIKSLENLWTIVALVLVIFSFLIMFICLFSQVRSQS